MSSWHCRKNIPVRKNLAIRFPRRHGPARPPGADRWHPRLLPRGREPSILRPSTPFSLRVCTVGPILLAVVFILIGVGAFRPSQLSLVAARATVMPSHRSRRSLDSGRRPSRPLAHERLEPRLALTAAQGLVAVGAQPEGALSGKIVYTSAGHGWQWSDTLDRYATDRGNLLSLVEDFGNQDQLTFYVDHLFRAGATVVPMRPVGRQPNEVVLDNDSADVVWSGSWLTSTSGTRWYDED